MATINIVPNPNNSDPQNIGIATQRWTAVHANSVGSGSIKLDPLTSAPADVTNLLYILNGVLHQGADPVSGSQWAYETLTVSSGSQTQFTLAAPVDIISSVAQIQVKVNGIDLPQSAVSISNTTLTYNPSGLYNLETDDTVQVWYIKA